MLPPNRATDRKRTFIAGRLTFGGGALSASCNVRDLSPQGARVAVDPEITLPTRVTLEIPSRNLREEATLRWRNGDVVGLEFLSAQAAAEDGGDPLAQRVRALEEENAKLRKQVRDLRVELANRLARDEASN